MLHTELIFSTHIGEGERMELGKCIRRVIHRDSTLTNIIMRPTCITACTEYAPLGSDRVNRIEAEENSINKSIYDLNSEVSGSVEWFTKMGAMIANLPNLTDLTFEGLNIHATELVGFWNEISNSTSLTTLNYNYMNLDHWEHDFMDPDNLSSVLFLRCTLPNDMGRSILHENQRRLTTLRFQECSFMNTNTIKEIVAFATILAELKSITSFWFTSCSFDLAQSMCLVRCLREERERSIREQSIREGRSWDEIENPHDVLIHCNTSS